jgi:twitching motility protein PilI
VAPIRFGFRLGSIGLLVPPGMLSELVDDTEVYPLPTTPDWFHGLINLRGGLVPVFNLKKLLRVEDQGEDKPNLLVLNGGVAAVGVLIDGLPLTLDISKRLQQSPPLPAILREHSQAVYMREQEIWVEFDFDGFFRAAGNRIAF